MKANKIEKQQLSDEELKNVNGGELDTSGLWTVKCATEDCTFHLDTQVSFDDAMAIAREHQRATLQPDGTHHYVMWGKVSS